MKNGNKTLNKVPGTTVHFWIMMVPATTLGYIVGLDITVVFLLIVPVVQLRADRFHIRYY